MLTQIRRIILATARNEAESNPPLSLWRGAGGEVCISVGMRGEERGIAGAPFPASPINFLFVTKIAIIISFYSNYPHFPYKSKFIPAPYLLHTCSIPSLYMIYPPPIDILLFSFHKRITLLHSDSSFICIIKYMNKPQKPKIYPYFCNSI